MIYPKVKGRSFVAKWYETYSWLEYSICTNKAYSFVCHMFSGSDSITISSFDIDSNTLAELTKHSLNDNHKTNSLK